jgi:exopolysaccharide production protein ExoZ
MLGRCILVNSLTRRSGYHGPICGSLHCLKSPIVTNGESGLRLPALQALRGIAASLVVLFHFARLYQERRAVPSWIYDSGLGNLGACGVDLFFVISGFIMVYKTRIKAGNNDALIFLTRRILRIYPLYWVWTSVALTLWAGGQRLQHYSTLYVVSSYLLIPSFNGLDFHPLVRQGWTLSFEMFFYLVFACGICLKLRSSKLLFLAVTFYSLAFLGKLLAPDSGARYLLGNSILIEFLYGMLAAEILINLPPIHANRLVRSSSLALISVGVGALLCTLRFYDAYSLRFIFYGVPVFSIVLGAAMLGAASAPSLLVYLGDRSYSIYLGHGFFLMAYSFALKHWPSCSILSPDAGIVLAGAVTIALSAFTYSLIERPLSRALSLKGPSSRVQLYRERKVRWEAIQR